MTDNKDEDFDALYEDYLEDDDLENFDDDEIAEDFDIGGDDIFDDGDGDADKAPSHEDQFGEDDSTDLDDAENEDLSGVGQEKEKKFELDLSFNAIAIIGALVLGVIVLTVQLVTNKPPPPKDPFISSVAMSGATDGAIFGETNISNVTIDARREEEIQETKGFLYEPDILDGMEDNVSNEEEKIEQIEPKDISDSQENDSIDIIKVRSSEITQTVQKKTSLTPLKEFFDKKPATKNEQIIDDAPEPRPDEPIKFSDINEFIKKAPPQKTGPSPEPQGYEELSSLQQQIKSLNTRLSILEEKNQSLQSEIKQKDEALKSLQKGKIEAELALQQRATQLAATMKESKQENKPKKTAGPLKESVAKTTPPAEKKASIIWELRAAQPGKAWVSEKGKRDIKIISVGDKLHSIGTVKTIEIENNRWVVKGSEGQIRQ